MYSEKIKFPGVSGETPVTLVIECGCHSLSNPNCVNRTVFSFLNRTDKCICGCVNADKVLKSLRTLMCEYPVFSEGHLLLSCEQTKGRHWQGMISKYSLNGTPNGPQLSVFTWCVCVCKGMRCVVGLRSMQFLLEL